MALSPVISSSKTKKSNCVVPLSSLCSFGTTSDDLVRTRTGSDFDDVKFVFCIILFEKKCVQQQESLVQAELLKETVSIYISAEAIVIWGELSRLWFCLHSVYTYERDLNEWIHSNSMYLRFQRSTPKNFILGSRRCYLYSIAIRFWDVSLPLLLIAINILWMGHFIKGGHF